jgi:hypothetical protein
VSKYSRRGFIIGTAGLAAGTIANPFGVATSGGTRTELTPLGGAARLQAMLAAAGSRAVISGQWILEAPVTIPKSVQSLELDATCRLIVRGNHAALTRRGTVKYREKLPAKVKTSSTTVPVGNISKYRLNEYVLLSSANTLPNASVRPGYIRKVSALGEDSIKIDKQVPRTLDSDVRLSAMSLAPSVTIFGEGQIYAEDPSATRAPLIEMFAVSNPQIRGISIHHSGGSGVRVEHCYKGEASCNVSDLLDDEARDHFGYGVNVVGSTRGLVVKGTARRVRHAVTTNAAAYITDVGSVGEPEDCIFAPAAFDCTNKALDTHRSGWNILMIPNVTGGVGAVQIRADNTRVEGGLIQGCSGPGISVFPEVAVAAKIKDVVVRDISSPGAALRSSGPSVVDRLTIRECVGGPNMELGANCTVRGGSISGGNPVAVHFMGSDNVVTDLQLGPSVLTPHTSAPGATRNSFSAAPPHDIEDLPAPVALSPITIAGTYAVAHTLTVTPATWNLGGLNVAYDWYRDGSAIQAATNRTYRTYTTVSEDLGHALSVTMRVSKPGYRPAESSSAPTPRIAPGEPLEPTIPPSVSGSGKVNTYLEASRGSWTGSPAAKTVSHEWLIDDVPSGITSSSVLVKTGDLGKRYRIRVTARRPGWQDGIAESNSITVAS